ncbi:MAG: C25 family cysteine peptidase, partial [bacterium]|nr:C25 family cysteine peptidase [bacterium]
FRSPKQHPVRKHEPDLSFAFNEKAYASTNAVFGVPYRILNNKTIEIYPYDYIPAKNMLIARRLYYDYPEKNVKSADDRVLIVYGDIFSLYEDSLRDYYSKRGYVSEAFPLSVCGSSVYGIDSFLENQYSSEPYSHLLLIGSSSVIPYFSGSGTDYPATDLYYSLMDTLDYFPDINVSRLPFSEPGELFDYLEKTRAEYSGSKERYSDKAYFIASNDGYYHTVVESTHAYSMQRLRSDGYDCDSLYGFYVSGTPISEALREGRELAVYSGHGSAFYWVGPSFYDTDIDTLLNSPNFPVVLSFACLTGNYAYTDFFGYNWLKSGDNGSASFIGSSQYTYWSEDDLLQRSFIDSLTGSFSIIDAMNKAKKAFYGVYGDVPITRGYFERYNYFMMPEKYSGNKSVSQYSFVCDRYQPLSLGNADASALFEGNLDRESFTALFYNGSIADSFYFFLPSDFQYDISGLLINVGDSVLLTDYVPGQTYNERWVKMIGDGSFVSLFSYDLSDFKIDTFSFDLTFKNFGTTPSESSRVEVRGLDESVFRIISPEISFLSLKSDSSVMIKDGLVIEIEGYSDSALTAVCSLYTITGADSVCEIVSLGFLRPEFEVKFEGDIFADDTIQSIILGAFSKVMLSVENLSSLKMKNVDVKLSSKSFTSADSIKTIDSLSSAESRMVYFDVFAYSSSEPVCSLTVSLTLGNFSDTVLLIVPTAFKNSSMYLGPVNGWYIYTNEMTDFENSPVFERIELDSFAFRQVETRDDTTLSIKLPFEFSFQGIRSDSLFFNTNGILSVFDIPDESYLFEPLPTSHISNPSIFACWTDYRCEYYDDYFQKPSDAKNTIFSYFDTLNYRYLIYYNKVKADGMEHSFALCIDTSEVTVHFYEMPESNSIVSGIQFDSDSYLSYSVDTTGSGVRRVRENLSVKYSPFEPRLKNKFTLLYEKDLNLPHIDSPLLMKRGSLLKISFNQSSFYDVSVYDVSGRLINKLYEGIMPKSRVSFAPQLSGGIFFVIIKNTEGAILKRKIVVL